MLRNVFLASALSLSVASAPAVVFADESPLPAGGPAAQGEAALPAIGTIVEVGGILFVVTAAGLVLFDDDDSAATSTTSST